MKTVILLPKTNRLKQLIKEHGNKWEFIQSRKVQCFNDIGIMIQSLNKEHFRWIKPSDCVI